jgi:hypothetical protein
MAQMKNMSGQKFGRLTVSMHSHTIKRPNGGGGIPYWICLCECGKQAVVKGDHLRAGKINSCGCFRREFISKIKTTHGMRRTRLYGIWCHIRQRCENKNDISYHSYGGRGIIVCKRWQLFEKFQTDMGSTWYQGASIERLNVNGNYEPSNCTWIPLADQAKNRQNSIIIDSPWGRLNAMYVAAKIGISFGTMYGRIHRWPKERWCEPKHSRF